MKTYKNIQTVIRVQKQNNFNLKIPTWSILYVKLKKRSNLFTGRDGFPEVKCAFFHGKTQVPLIEHDKSSYSIAEYRLDNVRKYRANGKFQRLNAYFA